MTTDTALPTWVKIGLEKRWRSHYRTMTTAAILVELAAFRLVLLDDPHDTCRVMVVCIVDELVNRSTFIQPADLLSLLP